MSSPAEQLIVVMVTVPDQATALSISRDLVERKLAACVNILPNIISVYQWQGSIEQSEEVVLLIKSARPRYLELERAILDLHPYDTPEVLALPPAAGSVAYSHWVLEHALG